jgi:DNA-binding CsgD family transcriptional regulator
MLIQMAQPNKQSHTRVCNIDTDDKSLVRINSVNDESESEGGLQMTNNLGEERKSDRDRLIFEHVDRRGRVRLLPLSLETQKLFAMGLSGEPRKPLAQGHAPFEMQSATQTFTAREMEVFDLLVAGLSSKQIAHELHISSRTVEIHRANLMRKMGVHNTASLIRAVSCPDSRGLGHYRAR